MSHPNEIELFDFSTDLEFQTGLSTILADAADAPVEVRHAIEEQAKIFFFNRKMGTNLDASVVAEARQRRQRRQNQRPDAEAVTSRPSTSAAEESGETLKNAGDEEPPYPPSFSRLAELISTNQAHLIPNNDVIPDVLNEAPPSQPTQSAKRKPWE